MDVNSYNTAIADVIKMLTSDLVDLKKRHLDHAVSRKHIRTPLDNRLWTEKDIRIVEHIRVKEMMQIRIGNMAKGWPYEGEPNG
jgi:hypothetical protein